MVSRLRRRAGWLALPLVCVVVSLTLLRPPVRAATSTTGAATAGAAAAAAVTIRLGDVLAEAYLGVGVDFAPYPLEIGGPAWDRIFRRLDFMRPGLIRTMITASVYTDGFRPDGSPVYRWDKPKMRQLRRILDWAQRRGVTVVIGEWTLPLAGQPGSRTWPARITRFVNHLYASGYSTVRYYNLINEPDRSGYPEACAKAALAGQSDPPPVWRARWTCWRDAVNRLRTALDADPRARRIRMVGPDSTEWLKWHPRDVRECPEARGTGSDAGAAPRREPVPDCWLRHTADRMSDRIGLFTVHRYASVDYLEAGRLEHEMRGLRRHITASAGAGRPFVMGEAGIVDADGDENQQLRFGFPYGVWMADYVLQSVRAGQAGVVAWSLDDALHGADAARPEDGYGSRHLKGWGFWNSLAGRFGYPASDAGPRPWFYSWSVLSRAFPAGARTLAVPPSGVAGLRVAAAVLPGRRPGLSLAVVNDADRPASVTVTAATGPLDLAEYRYFAGQRPVDADGLPVSRPRTGVDLRRGLRITLPGRGLVVLTGTG